MRVLFFKYFLSTTGIEDTTAAASNSFRLGFMPKDVQMGNWDDMVGGLVDVSNMKHLLMQSGILKID